MKPGRVFEFGKLRGLFHPTLMQKFLIPKIWYGNFHPTFEMRLDLRPKDKTQNRDGILRKKWDEFTANVNESNFLFLILIRLINNITGVIPPNFVGRNI